MLAPGLVKNLLYPAHELLMLRPTFKYWRELEQTQYKTREQIEAIQLERLRQLLQSAHQNSDWYGEKIQQAGLDLKKSAFAWDDLKRLPIIDKAVMNQYREQMVWKQVPGGAHLYNTGGSSGQPLIFYFGRSRQAADAANRMRARRWWDVDVGDKELYLWGAPVELNATGKIKTIRDKLFNQLVLNAFQMSANQMQSYLKIMQKFQPKCIYGYASSVSLLASYAKAENIPMTLPELKVVCTTGEPLYPEQRSLLEQVFQVPVANEYGCRDVGLIAHQAPSGEMLVSSETVIVEILDKNDQAVANGDVGEAVMTGLCSEAQPFIRYRTGDVMVASNALASDGKGLHVIQQVQGRTTDFIVLKDGTVMHALAVIYILRETPNIAKFKLIQHSHTQFEVKIIADQFWQEGQKEEVVAGLKQRLGEEVSIDIVMTTNIPVEASGKYRYIVSHVSLPWQ